MIGKISAILWKDIVSEFRTKEMISSMLVFSLIISFVLNFAFPTGSQLIQEAAPGMLWMTFIFASLLGMNRTFVYEVDKGCLHGLMLTPVDRNVIYISKMVVNFLLILLMEFIVLPIFAIFFHLDILAILPVLLVIILLSTIGIAVIGTLFSAISVNTRTREVMLPILYFPVSIPIIFGAVQSTTDIFQGKSWEVIWSRLKIVVAFDLIFLIVALLLFEYIIEE
ncbi:MAG: heme ABC transporter permease CcmB [Calditrichaeota bacterium]|nr:MAG: heme ABC transporter permease CcmB [Calditrichota bacterium]